MTVFGFAYVVRIEWLPKVIGVIDVAVIVFALLRYRRKAKHRDELQTDGGRIDAQVIDGVDEASVSQKGIDAYINAKKQLCSITFNLIVINCMAVFSCNEICWEALAVWLFLVLKAPSMRELRRDFGVDLGIMGFTRMPR